MSAIVTQIQVAGGPIYTSLEKACVAFINMRANYDPMTTKIHFTIQLPNGETKTITIRDEDKKTVAYGDFEGLPSFLDYAKEVG